MYTFNFLNFGRNLDNKPLQKIAGPYWRKYYCMQPPPVGGTAGDHKLGQSGNFIVSQMSKLQIGWKIWANLWEVKTTEIGFARWTKSLFLRTLLTQNFKEHMSHKVGTQSWSLLVLSWVDQSSSGWSSGWWWSLTPDMRQWMALCWVSVQMCRLTPGWHQESEEWRRQMTCGDREWLASCKPLSLFINLNINKSLS